MQSVMSTGQHQSFKKEYPSHSSSSNPWRPPTQDNYRSFRVSSGSSGSSIFDGISSRFASHSTSISSAQPSFSNNHKNQMPFMRSSGLLKPSHGSLSSGFRLASSTASDPLPMASNKFASTSGTKKYGSLGMKIDNRNLFAGPKTTQDSLNTGNKLFRLFTSDTDKQANILDKSDTQIRQESKDNLSTGLDSQGPGANTLGDLQLDPEIEFLNFIKYICLIGFQLLKMGFLWGLTILKFAASILQTYINNIPDMPEFKKMIGVQSSDEEIKVDQLIEADGTLNEATVIINNRDDLNKGFLNKLIPTGFSTPLSLSTKRILSGSISYNANTIDETPSLPSKASSINLLKGEKINTNTSATTLTSRLKEEEEETHVDQDFKIPVSLNGRPKLKSNYGTHFFSSDMETTDKLDIDTFLHKTATEEHLSSQFANGDSGSLVNGTVSGSDHSMFQSELMSSRDTLKAILLKTREKDNKATKDQKSKEMIKRLNQLFDRKFNELKWKRKDSDDYVSQLDSTELYTNYQKIMEERAKLKKLISMISTRSVKVADLAPDQMSIVTSYSKSFSLDQKVVDAFNIPIKVRDIKTLDLGRWLNDNVIDFYLSLIVLRSKNSIEGNKNPLPKIHAFTTHFYSTLADRGYQGVARWAKRAKVDVTKVDYVFVPVNLRESHWVLAVVNNKEKRFQFYDSLFGSGTQVLENLAGYMMQEAKRIYGEQGNGINYYNYQMDDAMITPKQENGSDCGVFTCTTVEYISREKPLTFAQSDMPVLRRRMVYEIATQKLINEQ